MVSSYLERPLRSLDQALEDRDQARVPSTLSVRAPGDLPAQAADSPAAAPDRSPLGHRHAA